MRPTNYAIFNLHLHSAVEASNLKGEGLIVAQLSLRTRRERPIASWATLFLWRQRPFRNYLRRGRKWEVVPALVAALSLLMMLLPVEVSMFFFWRRKMPYACIGPWHLSLFTGQMSILSYDFSFYLPYQIRSVTLNKGDCLNKGYYLSFYFPFLS